MFLVGRLIGVCSLPDIDAERGLITCTLGSDRPDGQTVHPRAELHRGFI